MSRVIGIDGCRKGWVGLTDDAVPRGYFATTIADLVSLAENDGPLAVVGVDMPIGLPIRGVRQADVLARAAVGRLSSSVFPTPVRAALAAATHAEAVALSVEHTGKGLSVQSYGLRHRILEVDGFVRLGSHTVIEVHPELSFATMAGRSLVSRKSTWRGIEERRQLLKEQGIEVPAQLGTAGEMAAVDDVLDAAAAAWSAARFAAGRATPHPDTPEVFGEGPAAAIWA